jgi:hypothetical protein
MAKIQLPRDIKLFSSGGKKIHHLRRGYKNPVFILRQCQKKETIPHTGKVWELFIAVFVSQ